MVLISHKAHNCLSTVRHSSPYMVITAQTQREKRNSERKRRGEKQIKKETVNGQNEEKGNRSLEKIKRVS